MDQQERNVPAPAGAPRISVTDLAPEAGVPPTDPRSLAPQARRLSGGGAHGAIACAVVGASGYAGAELVGLLAAHPRTRLKAIQADGNTGRRWEEIYPGRAHLFRGRLGPSDPDVLAGLDAVFLALPHGASASMARQLAGKVGAVIDLSGDLRLRDPEEYRRWYGMEHVAPELLGMAVYGLPELFGDLLPGAPLVACGGCYATVAQLCAAPALALGEAIGGEITVSAMSGTTGAGRKAEIDLSFSEVAGNLRAYRVGKHPHAPEIAQGLRSRTGRRVSITFVPHLVPIGRGIFATVVLPNPGKVGQADLLAAYRNFYSGRPLVRVIDPAERFPQVSDVAGTGFCDVAPMVDESAGTIVVLGALDNLLKGAAAQAVQVMNLVFGLPEESGLLPGARVPTEEVCHA